MAMIKVRDKDGNIIDIPALNGESAYNIAVKNGFVGTEQEWLDSLKGDSPVKGIDYWTDSDIAEIKAYVDNAILREEW